MHLIEAFIRNPVKVSVGVLLTALFGAISLYAMPKQLTPEVQNPVLTVETRWPGASPQEVEREIVQEQEEQLQSVEGLIKLSSECMDSTGKITMEFVVGTNIEDAMMRVNTRLQQVREYPIDALEPVIQASDATDQPIARYMLTAKPPTVEAIAAFQQAHPALADRLETVKRAMNSGLRVYRLQKLADEIGEEFPEIQELVPPTLDLQKMRKFAEDVIEARLERVPGVADANTYGGQQEELQVIVDPVQLAARQITITDVRNALNNQNRDTSAGDFWEGKRRWVIRTLGQFRDPEQVRRQVLAVRDGAPIYIGDVAEVRVGFKKMDSVSRRYGMSSNGLSVQRASGANVLQVMEGLRAATTELNEGILAQRGLELFQYYDETEYIDSAVGLVQQNIFIGGALTMIVLLLFLHLGLRSLLVTPLIAVSAVAAAYVSPWYFLVTLAAILVAGFWFGRDAHRRTVDSDQHHWDVPAAATDGAVTQRHQPGGSGVRRGYAGGQRGRRPGEHLPPVSDGRDTTRCFGARHAGSLGGGHRLNADDRGRVSSGAVRAGDGRSTLSRHCAGDQLCSGTITGGVGHRHPDGGGTLVS